MFGSVCNILVSGQEVFFEIEQMEAIFCQHYHAYALSLSSSHRQHFLIKHKDLIVYHPHGLYHCPNISNTLPSQYTVLRSNNYMYIP